MKINRILKYKKTLSFEIFPPKEGKSLDPLSETLNALNRHNPDFISCTYGAGGTNEGRSLEVCKMIIEQGQTVLPHFTCIANTKDVIEKYINQYEGLDIENVLLLRGDIPEGWTNTKSDFSHASELINYFRKTHPKMGIAAAAYPEAHMESIDSNIDIEYLKLKQDSGTEFFITQFCHDVKAYEKFIKKIRNAGITIPVVVGLMPILTREGTIRMTLTNGCSIPAELSRIMGVYKNDLEAYKRAGKEYTVKLINEYLETDIGGLHLYTLNKHDDIDEIIEKSNIRRLLK